MTATAARKNGTCAGGPSFDDARDDARVQAQFKSYRPLTRRSLMAMQALIFETAVELPATGGVMETLK